MTDKKPNKKDRKKYMDKSRKIHNNKIGSKKLYKNYCYNVRVRKKRSKQ